MLIDKNLGVIYGSYVSIYRDHGERRKIVYERQLEILPGGGSRQER